MVDSITRILGIVDIFSESLDYFDNEELALERYKELAREQSIDESQEGKREKFLKQLETSSTTQEGIKRKLEPLVKVRQDSIEARQIEDEEERVEAYDNIFDEAQDISNDKRRVKERQIAGRMKQEAVFELARQERFFQTSYSSQIPYRSFNRLMSFYGFDNSDIDRVENHLSDIGLTVDNGSIRQL